MGIGTTLLATKGLAIETYEPGWLITLLAIITDPNVAVILMLIGVAGSLTMTSVGKGIVGRVRPPLTEASRRMSTPSPSRPATR